jgi:hypothetical protein
MSDGEVELENVLRCSGCGALWDLIIEKKLLAILIECPLCSEDD